MSHTCHVPLCNVPVPPKMLMCLRHWRQVPQTLQREVWRTWRPGQEQDKKPSEEYLTAAHAAIRAVQPQPPAGPAPGGEVEG